MPARGAGSASSVKRATATRSRVAIATSARRRSPTMALIPSKLAQGILDLASGRNFPKDPYEAGRRFAHSYAQYAANALSFAPAPAPPNSLTAGEHVLAAALGAIWTTSRIAPQ